MCATCDQLGREIRWPKDAMSQITAKIDNFVAQGKLAYLGEVAPKGHFVEVKYQCSECGVVWKLRYPDQGMTGGFARE